MKKNIISITDSAADHIRELLKKDSKMPIGIGINVETGGCSGSKYKFEYI
jgi:Fe-S cluster assembly iron-binding protein IscA